MTIWIKTPWTPDQVDALNRYQHSGRFHGYTCNNYHIEHQLLVATEDGWICPMQCGYTQDWAHAISFLAADL